MLGPEIEEVTEMNLFYLRYFVTLAHIGHYTHAAEQLCITQPSLSHAVAQLEKELGVPLFEKTGRNTTLTRFGAEFLACAEQTLSTLDAGVTSLQRSARGEGLIRLGLLRTLGVDYIPRLAAGFLQAHPELELRFTFHTGVTQTLLEGLAARKFDLAFCAQPPAGQGFSAVPVQRQELVLIVPKDHPLSDRETVDLAETAPYPQVFFDSRSGVRGVVDQMFAQIGLEPRIAYETEEDQVVAGLVAHGFGIAVVPYMELLHRLDLAILRLSAPAGERQLFMIRDSRAFLSPAADLFRQYVLREGR